MWRRHGSEHCRYFEGKFVGGITWYSYVYTACVRVFMHVRFNQWHVVLIVCLPASTYIFYLLCMYVTDLGGGVAWLASGGTTFFNCSYVV